MKRELSPCSRFITLRGTFPGYLCSDQRADGFAGSDESTVNISCVLVLSRSLRTRGGDSSLSAVAISASKK